MASPVIENLRNMRDLCCLLTAPQNKVEILRSVEIFAETANLVENCLAHHKDMTDIVDRAKEVKVKVRFKIRGKIHGRVAVYLILVGVDDIGGWILVQDGYHLVQCIDCNQIVVVTQHYIIAVCHSNCCIRISSNSLVLFQLLVTDSFFFSIFFADKVTDLFFRTPICQAEFPVCIRLGCDGYQQFVQITDRCIKQWNDDTNLWLIRKFCFALLFQFF